MLSPVDIQNKMFKKVKIGGYHVEEVNEFMEQVAHTCQELTNENYALKDKINVLNESIQYYRTMETTIQNVLVMADKTAQDTKSSAYEKAENIKQEAQQRADKLLLSAEDRVNKILEKGRQDSFEWAQKIDALQKQYTTYKAQLKQLLEAQLEILENTSLDTILQEEVKEAMAVNEVAMTEDISYYTREYMPIEDAEEEQL